MGNNKINRKIFLENLPRNKGKGSTKNKLVINWIEVVKQQFEIKFIYDNIEGWIKIVEYNKDTRKLTIEYNKNNYYIATGDLRKCALGNIIGKITSDFKIEIGTRFQDDKRDITITDREYRKEENIDKQGRKSIANRKYYKYTCNRCGWTEGWMIEGSLLSNRKVGCSCCHGNTVVEGINDIPTTTPWLIPYFQGGYDEAKLYTANGSGRIIPICPDCGRIKDKSILISNIYRTHSIGCSCSDSISYGEKLMFSVLKQLNINFITQLNKSIYNWCDVYKYDFCFEINDEQYIIETHGDQHYIQQRRKGARTIEEEQENDRIKKELALSNGIKENNYLVIDCRKSELEWIRDNDNGILNSRLNELFDLNNIDWNKCHEFALGNKAKEACEYKRNNPDMSTTEIGKIMNLHEDTIRKYLKKGNEIGWCYYNAEEEKLKGRKRHSGIYIVRPIKIFKDKVFLGEFESASELERQSEKLFGVKLRVSSILRVCKKKIKEYKGYTFEYIETN